MYRYVAYTSWGCWSWQHAKAQVNILSKKTVVLLLTLDPTRWQSPVQVALWCYASAFQLCPGFQCALFEFPRAPREVHCWGVNDQGTAQSCQHPQSLQALNLVDGWIWWRMDGLKKLLLGRWMDFRRVLKVNLVRATPLLGHWSRLGRKKVAWEKSQKCARFLWITET